MFVIALSHFAPVFKILEVVKQSVFYCSFCFTCVLVGLAKKKKKGSVVVRKPASPTTHYTNKPKPQVRHAAALDDAILIPSEPDGCFASAAERAIALESDLPKAKTFTNTKLRQVIVSPMLYMSCPHPPLPLFSMLDV